MTLKVDKSGVWQDVLDLQVNSGGAWRRVLSAYVLKSGTWQPCYTYVPNINTTTSVSVSNTAPLTATNITISGTVTPASGSVPTGSTVELYDGATKLATTTTGAGGAYSFTIQFASAATYTLTVKFLLNGYYQPSQANTPAIAVHSTTTCSLTVPGDTVVGASFNLSGTVTAASAQTPADATVTVQRSTDNVNWTTDGTTTSSAGAWSYSTSYATPNTTVYWRAVYAGTANFDSSTSSSATIFFMRPTPGALTATGGTLTTSSATFSWTASSDATSYDVYKNNVLLASNVSSPYTATGLAQDTSYAFFVRARNENTTDGATDSNTITANIGHAAIIDSGTITDATWSAVETNSYRSIDGWGYLGTDLAQGYYSSSNGPYYGIARFDTAAMRTYIDAYGTDRAGRYNHITCTKMEVYATRQTGSGTSAAVPIGWYMSTTNPGSGTPSISLGPDTSSPSGLATGDSGWLTLPDETWGVSLVKGTYQSIAMYYNGSANYSQYNGGSGFKVRMSFSWNYTYLAAKAGTWS